MWSLVLVVSVLVAVASAASVRGPKVIKREVALSEPRTKCMDDLGCFPITDDFFHPIYRPINLLPADKESINTKFYLFTRKNLKNENMLKANKKSIDASTFDVKKKTKLLVHGWLDAQWLAKWMHDMKDDFLLAGDCNVIIVDWSGGNKLPYTKAAANTRVVGAEIAHLLLWLKDNKSLKLEDCHILGHSLGAHVAGYAGERLKGLARITAMDPAEPYFQHMPASVRIDPTDATFVDVIHTDSNSIIVAGLGMSQLVGHVDFFPNGGANQPGCDISKLKTFVTEGLVGGVRNVVACNHHRAMDFVRDAILPGQCIQTAYACDSWDEFRGGQCADCGTKGEKCAIVGETQLHYSQFKNSPQKMFFYKTNNQKAWCLFQYRVEMKVHTDNDKDKSGAVVLKVKGSKSTAEFKLNDGNAFTLSPGTTYSFVLTSTADLGDLKEMVINWQPGLWGAIIQRKVKLDYIKISSMNGLDERAKRAKERKYCAARLGELSRATDHLLRATDVC